MKTETAKVRDANKGFSTVDDWLKAFNPEAYEDKKAQEKTEKELLYRPLPSYHFA